MLVVSAEECRSLNDEASWALLQHYSSRRIIFLLGRAQKGACLPVDEQSRPEQFSYWFKAVVAFKLKAQG